MQSGHFSKEALEQAEIQIKYEVYLQKEEEMVKNERPGKSNYSG